jgi:PAS domain S-box-containing protein
LKRAVTEEPTVKGDLIQLPTGELHLKELLNMLNTLPVGITFVDKNDTVRFFSDKQDRIFVRTKAAPGRKVQNCHPPKSLEVVERILQSFKKGTRDSADFWINFKGRFVFIRYFAVRDREGNYLGTMEVTQDVTEIKKLEGRKGFSTKDLSPVGHPTLTRLNEQPSENSFGSCKSRLEEAGLGLRANHN